MKKIYLILILLTSFTVMSFGQGIDEGDIGACIRMYKYNHTTGESVEVTSSSIPYDDDYEYFIKFNSKYLNYDYASNTNYWLFQWSTIIPYYLASGQEVRYTQEESGYGLITTSTFPMSEDYRNNSNVSVNLTVSGMGIKDFSVHTNVTWYFYHQNK